MSLAVASSAAAPPHIIRAWRKNLSISNCWHVNNEAAWTSVSVWQHMTAAYVARWAARAEWGRRKSCGRCHMCLARLCNDGFPSASAKTLRENHRERERGEAGQPLTTKSSHTAANESTRSICTERKVPKKQHRFSFLNLYWVAAISLMSSSRLLLYISVYLSLLLLNGTHSLVPFCSSF